MAVQGQTQYYKTPAQGWFSDSVKNAQGDRSKYVEIGNYYQAMPYAGNNPYGYTPISLEEYVQGLERAASHGDSYATEELQKVKSNQGIYSPDYNDGSLASFTNPLTGEVLHNVPKATVDNIEKQVEGIKNGTLKLVGNGMTIPTGSASDLQLQGKTYDQQLVTPSVQQQIKDQNLQPVNPNSPAPSNPVSTGSAGSGTSNSASSGGVGGGFTEFVKSPNDNTVYGKTADGKYVGFETWDQLLAVNGGKAPQINTVQSTPSSSINYSQYTQQVTQQQTGVPDLGPYTDLYKQMQEYLDKLQKNGQVINPNVQITPDQLAAFTQQAADQIHPYYRDQLAAATDSFLSGLGYNTDQFKNSIKQAETQYGRNLEGMSSNFADQGFAQSGIRGKAETNLANDTQNNLDQLRGSLFNTSQNAARSFAQQYGGAGVPTAPTLGAAPRVLPGQGQFDTSGAQQGLYQLDPSIYGRLIGSEQNSEKQATDNLASQLAENANKLTANQQQRSLI